MRHNPAAKAPGTGKGVLTAFAPQSPPLKRYEEEILAQTCCLSSDAREGSIKVTEAAGATKGLNHGL